MKFKNIYLFIQLDIILTGTRQPQQVDMNSIRLKMS